MRSAAVTGSGPARRRDRRQAAAARSPATAAVGCMVRIAVTGSIATDHLMTFTGRFADSLVVEQLDKIALSFLVDDLRGPPRGSGRQHRLRHGQPGPAPAAGRRGRARTSWTTAPGWSATASTATSVHVSETRHTARFVCTTDSDHAQIATFYAGAMSEAREIELGPIAARAGGLDLVVVGPNDPEAMLRHTDECRTRGHPVRRRPSPAAGLDGRRRRSASSSTARPTCSPTSTKRR